MSFIEFIGFVISMAALIWLSVKRGIEERRRQSNPEAYASEREQEQQRYHELLKSLDLPIPEELLEAEHKTGQSSHRQKKQQQQIKQQPKAQGQQSAAKAWKAPETKRTVRDYKFRAPLDTRRQASRIENRRLNNAIEARQNRFRTTVVSKSLQPEEGVVDPYSLEEASQATRSQDIFAQLKDPIQMVVFHELMSKPKALQKVGRLQGLPWEG
ncbi:MAG: hypothetical protein Q8K75_10480 [Chlamydiales bacterium]|nr:hypothetical protein [Chlamydiales bacterium]